MAEPLVPDDLGAVVAPPLSPSRAHPEGRWPPIPDRAALNGILIVLRTGLPWEYRPQAMDCGSGTSCWRQLRDWEAAGVQASLQGAVLEWLTGWGRLDGRRGHLDNARAAAEEGLQRSPIPLLFARTGSRTRWPERRPRKP